MALIRCQGCGAPLNPAADASQVECTYCGATTLINRHKGRSSAAGSGTSRSRIGWVVFGVLTLAVVGTAGFFLFGSGGGFAGLSLYEFYGAACPVKANEDDVIDFAGRTGLPGGGNAKLAVLDGTSGKTLWTGPVVELEPTLVCLGPDLYGVAFPDFRLELWSPAASDEPVGVVKLPERLERWGRRDDCIGLQTRDGDVFVDAKTGRTTECQVSISEDLEPPGWLPEPFTLEDGEIQYTLSFKESGTKFISATARKGDEELWTAPLPIAGLSSDRVHFAHSDDALFVYGSRPGDDFGTLIALERDSGRVRFEKPQRTGWSTNFPRTFVFNGRHLVMTWGFGLHAYDAQSGERVWNQGGR